MSLYKPLECRDCRCPIPCCDIKTRLPFCQACWDDRVERDPDCDLELFDVERLRDELRKARSVLRDVVTQEGDDLCWLDFYKAAAELLPEAHKLENLQTLPPKPVMMHNCERYVDCLASNRPYVTDTKDVMIDRLLARIHMLTNELEGQ